MSIVCLWPLDVGAYIEQGREVQAPRPPCPLCFGPTRGWSGYWRHLRIEEDKRIWIPRVRCEVCLVTQALLPWFVVPWRWDVVDVIVRALVMNAKGIGVGKIAAVVGRPALTVRGWCRRYCRVAEAGEVTRALLELAVRWGWSGWDLPTEPRARCGAAVVAVAARWRRWRGPVRAWRLGNLITGGRLLAINTTGLLAAPSPWAWMGAKSITEVADGP